MGIRTKNIDAVSTITSLVGVKTAAGVSSTGRIATSDLATQLASTSPLNAVIAAGAFKPFATKALIDADLAYVAKTVGWVYDDPAIANNGIYVKSGISGAGSWSRIMPLPYSFAKAAYTEPGTVNAIQAESDIAISESTLVLLDIEGTNTVTPVTVAFNGGAPLTVKTASGADVPVGAMVSGLGVVSGGDFRMLNDVTSAAIQAAAEAAAAAAAASAAQVDEVVRPGITITRETYGIHVGKGTSNNVPQTPNHDLHYGSLRVWDAGVTHRQIAALGNWSRLDEIVTRANALGVKLIYCLGQAPASMTGGTVGDVGGNAAYNSKPYSNLTDLATFVTDLLTRYPGVFKALEDWNEWNIQFYTGTDQQMVDMCEAIHGAATAIDPDIRLISPSVTNQTGIAALDRFLALGGGDFVTDIGVHAYAATPEEGIELMRAYRAVADKHGQGDKPMINTEWTTTTYAEGGVIKSAPATYMSPRDGSAEIVKLMLAPLIAGCTESYLYGMDYSFSSVQMIDPVTPATLYAPAHTFKTISDETVGYKLTDYSAAADGSCILRFVDADLGTKLIAWGAKGRSPVFNPSVLGVTSIKALDSSGLFADAEVDTNGFTLRDPIICTVGPASASAKSQPMPEAVSGPSFSIIDNADFKNRGFDDLPVGWENTFQGIANYDVVANGPEFSSSALVLTPSSQFRQIRTFLSQVLEPGKYAIYPDYKTADANYKVIIETPGGNPGPPFSVDRPLPVAARRTRLEVPFFVTILYRSRIKVALGYQAASGFGAITLESLDVRKIGEPPKQRESYQRKVIRSADGVPPSGNINTGDEHWYSTAARIASDGCVGRKAKTDGTLGTLSGVTCNTTSGSRVITNITGSDRLEPGNYISIVGVTGTKLVTKRLSSNSVEIDSTASATVTGAAVAYVAPTWTSMGFSMFTDGAAMLPDVEVSGADGTVRSLSVGAVIAGVFRRRFSWRANAETVTGSSNAGANIELSTAKDDGTDQVTVVQINRNSGFAQWLASSFKLAGTWDKAFIVNGWRLWQHAVSGALLFKAGSPASDDDGLAVALQNALASFTSMRMVGADGAAREIQFGNLSGSTFTPRFGLRLNADAVTGSGNAGANVELVMYNDAGSQINVAIKLTRASGFFEALASSFKLAGTWDKAFILNGVRLWQHATTFQLMTKASAPASDSDGFPVMRQVAVPATATSAGQPGDFALAAGFAYFCRATNTWERVATATW